MRNSIQQRLSRISTSWDDLQLAIQSDDDEQAVLARTLLFERYGPAVKSYLLALTRNEEAAEELSQQFALKLVGGKFKHANPQKGRFRAYLKTALIRMAWRYKKRNRHDAGNLALDDFQVDPDWQREIEERLDQQFIDAWKNTLLDRTWSALLEVNRRLHDALRTKVRNPDSKSDELAAELSTRFDQQITPVNARKMVHRARIEFANLLIDEIARSVNPGSIENVEQELIDLNLMKYCKEVFDQLSQPEG